MAYDTIKDKGFDNRTTDEQREISKMGGQASGRSRKLKAIADKFGSYKAPATVVAEILGEEMAKEGYELTYDEAMLMAQYHKSFEGDTRAAEYLSKVKGEMVIKTENVHDVDGSLERLNGILRQKDATTDTDN